MFKQSHIVKCGEEFKTKKDHSWHMVVHKVVKTYECNVCGNKFSRFGNLVTCMKMHTPEKIMPAMYVVKVTYPHWEK